MTDAIKNVTEQENGSEINQQNYLEDQSKDSTVRQTLFAYFYSYCVCLSKTRLESEVESSGEVPFFNIIEVGHC
jgi:hypothetical protein